jgi:capsular polysaccharide biosynthesis protein
MHKKLFIGIVVVTVFLNYLFVIRIFEPSYQSQTTLLVSKRSADAETIETVEVLQAINVSEKLVFDLPGIILSSRVLEAVNRNLAGSGINAPLYSEIEFRRKVKTEILTNTRIVEVSVTNQNPEAAQLAARTIADTTRLLVEDLYQQQDYVNVIRIAELPERPHGLTHRLLWVIGVLGGILMGFLAILIITMADKYRQETGEESL